MAFTNPTLPNLADFLNFCLDQGVPAGNLPGWSPYPPYALNYALEVALPGAGAMGSGTKGYVPPYVMAVYQLAFHHLLQWTPDQAAGSLFSADITNEGSGYTAVPAVSFSAAPTGGTNATGTAILTGGAVTGITITQPGAGYTSAPTVTIAAGAGTQATAEATLTTEQTFFETARKKYEMNNFQSGVVLASGDQNTSQTLVVPELYKTLPMYAQDLVKSPWGRGYLQYAQTYGPSIVGYS